uniref:Uncharacterized protein n=1 Tax=Erpetoichthys calabaricus TaxID=27687 RepID=A0A8C4SVM1_ERPCA
MTDTYGSGCAFLRSPREEHTINRKAQSFHLQSSSVVATGLFYRTGL